MTNHRKSKKIIKKTSTFYEHPSTISWMFGGAIVAKTGNDEAYQKYSLQLHERFKESGLENLAYSERIAKGTLMLQNNPELVKLSRDYAMKCIESLSENDGFYNWTCFCVALAEYRYGNITEAEKWCKISLDKSPENHPFLPGLNNALLSIIYSKTDRKPLSAKSLEIAKQCQSNLIGSEGSLHDRFLIDVLISEHESLTKNSL